MAERLRERFEVQTITVIDAPEPKVQRRMVKHLRRMYAIKRNAERKAQIRGECEKAVAGWFANYVEQEWHRKVTNRELQTVIPEIRAGLENRAEELAPAASSGR